MSAVDNLVKYVDRYPDRLLGFVRMDPKGAAEVVRVFERTIKTYPRIKAGEGYVLFGNCAPYMDVSEIERVKAVQTTEAIKEKIFYKNIMELVF